MVSALSHLGIPTVSVFYGLRLRVYGNRTVTVWPLARSFTVTVRCIRNPYEPVKFTAVYGTIRPQWQSTSFNIIQCHFDDFADFSRPIRGPTFLGKPSVPPLPSKVSGDIADDRTDAPIIPIRTARHWLNLYVQAQKRKEKKLNPPDIETRHFGYILHSNGTLQ